MPFHRGQGSTEFTTGSATSLCLGELQDAEETMAIVALFEVVLYPRFTHDVALAVGGPLDKLAELMASSVADKDAAIMTELRADAAEFAEEFTVWLRRVLPAPDTLTT